MASMMVYACAKGGAAGDDDDDDTGDVDGPVHIDAASTIDGQAMIDAPPGTPDAPPNPPDAFVPHPDAFVPPPDAGDVNPPFCDSNDDCVEPDTCCFVVACVDGLAIGSACFPS